MPLANRCAKLPTFTGEWRGPWLAHRLLGDPTTTYYTDRASDNLSVGRRNGAIVSPLPDGVIGSIETYGSRFTEWRRELARIVSQHGGRVLPGYSVFRMQFWDSGQLRK